MTEGKITGHDTPVVLPMERERTARSSSPFPLHWQGGQECPPSAKQLADPVRVEMEAGK